jgi:hypothetical protein
LRYNNEYKNVPSMRISKLDANAIAGNPFHEAMINLLTKVSKSSRNEWSKSVILYRNAKQQCQNQ